MGIEDVSMLFTFIGGLGMFLYGMHIMAEGLQHFAGGRMQKLMGFLTQNRVMAILVGTLVTAVIQSSSATTVMVVGFVNAGMLNLSQAVGVIMGANIGTTVTAWIVSMSEWGSVLKPEFFAPLLVGIGAFVVLFVKSEKKKRIGEILIGFAILFIGLTFMSDAILPYRESPVFSAAFTVLGKNPILAVLAGAVVTAIIQSSSASVGILQTLAMNGIVGWNSAIFITLGQNIGTCVTALLSSAGSGRNGKRASVIHLSFNVFGAIIFGAQKNVAPAGLTVTIVRDDLLGRARKYCPSIFDWSVLASHDSMYNTPNSFAWYMAGLDFKWIKDLGGVAELEKRNCQKANLLYNFLDSTDFYRCPIAKSDRSRVNCVFTLKDESLNAKFLAQAKDEHLVGLKGHKVLGGMRASIYNAMPLEGVEVLVRYLDKFAKAHS